MSEYSNAFSHHNDTFELRIHELKVQRGDDSSNNAFCLIDLVWPGLNIIYTRFILKVFLDTLLRVMLKSSCKPSGVIKSSRVDQPLTQNELEITHIDTLVISLEISVSR